MRTTSPRMGEMEMMRLMICNQHIVCMNSIPSPSHSQSQGIYGTHKEFHYLDGRRNGTGVPQSRVLEGFNAMLDTAGTKDCNGHGSHVAGNS